MTDRRYRPETGEPQTGPSEPPRKKPSVRVIPGTVAVDPAKRRPPKIRVIADERLTPQELKKRFANNLDRLLGIVGLSRKDAAREVGIPYKLMRRLASAGVSFAEERNAESLSKIADFFTLPSVDDLWTANLVQRLLTTGEGSRFVKKFRDRLLDERERRVAAARVVGHDEVMLVGRALGVEDANVTPLSGADAEMVAAILASPKADTFRRVIGDYYELINRPAGDSDEERTAKKSAARA
jgi:hypothetical protein